MASPFLKSGNAYPVGFEQGLCFVKCELMKFLLEWLTLTKGLKKQVWGAKFATGDDGDSLIASGPGYDQKLKSKVEANFKHENMKMRQSPGG